MTARYRVLHGPIVHDGTRYGVGAELELDEATAAHLLRVAGRPRIELVPEPAPEPPKRAPRVRAEP